MNYATFLATKQRVWLGNGPPEIDVMPQLFPWQAALVQWAGRKGRAAIWADCGLGKTFMQLAWAHGMGKRTLIFAPLCVAEQTVEEGRKLGIPVTYALDQAGAPATGISITNYERLEKFNCDAFGAVVLDESSILKALDGVTRTKLIEACQSVPYRLCCTATPAPNDIAELANHAEFLGVCTRPEFLATWFVHDDEGWRLKRPARQAFYRWMASWAVALRTPSDIGFPDEGFILPRLSIVDEVLPSETPSGSLFPELAVKGLSGRLTARRTALPARMEAVARLIATDDTWLIWCGLNEESDAAALLPDVVNVAGSDTYAEKVAAVRGFVEGEIRVLASKPKILGFGMNFQHCHHMAFVGLSDSYEAYYQCLRRCWRFGQRFPVTAHILVSEAERLVVENVRRKEAQAASITKGLVMQLRDFEMEALAC